MDMLQLLKEELEHILRRTNLRIKSNQIKSNLFATKLMNSINSIFMKLFRTGSVALLKTHRPRYSVCSNRPHLTIAAMRPVI